METLNFYDFLAETERRNRALGIDSQPRGG